MEKTGVVERGKRNRILLTVDSRPPAAQFHLQAKITAISFRGKYYQVWAEASGERLMFELRSVLAKQILHRTFKTRHNCFSSCRHFFFSLF